MKKFFAVLLAVVGLATLTPSPAAAGVNFGFYFGPPAVYYGGPYYYDYPAYYPYYYPYYGYGYYRPYYGYYGYNGYYGYHHGYWGHRYWGHYHGYHHWR